MTPTCCDGPAMVRGGFFFRGAVDRQDRRHVAQYRLEQRVDARALRFAAERLPPNANDASRGALPRRARLWSERHSLDVGDDARARPWTESLESRANRPRERSEDPRP